MTISDLGRHGERAVPPERISLLPDDQAAARSAVWRIAVVLHTLESDLAKQQLARMVGIFGDCSASVIDVVDCGFSPDRQLAELDRLIAQRPDAILSLPVANEQVAAAHARVSAAGINLVLLDKAPTRLLPGTHYTALASAGLMRPPWVVSDFDPIIPASLGYSSSGTPRRLRSLHGWRKPDGCSRCQRSISAKASSSILPGAGRWDASRLNCPTSNASPQRRP